MRQWLRSHLTYANVMATLAVFLVLGGGSAVALRGSNTVFSDDIVDNQVKSRDVRNDTLTRGGLSAADLRPASVGTSEVQDSSLSGNDIAANSLTGGDIADNTLDGDDVNESQLGLVPAATLGGFGRSGSDTFCDPESTTLIVCTSVTLNLPAPTRVLVIGQIQAGDEFQANIGHGSCELGTNVVDLPSTSTLIDTGRDGDTTHQTDNTTLVGVTPPLGPGNVEFRIRCNQTTGGAIVYLASEIAAVALSPS